MKILDHLEEWLIAFLMAGATLLIFFSVLHRYLSAFAIPGVQDFMLSLNFSWAQELCIIMFVWMAKFGAAYGVRTGIHVGVDVVINRMEERNRSKFIIFGLLAGALFTGSIAYLGAHFVWGNGAHYAFLKLFGLPLGDVFEGPTTPDLEWPTWMVYSAIPLGSSLMCLRFLQVAWGFWQTGELPHHEHGHVEGIVEESVPIDVNPFSMSDNLHPHDLKHEQLGERRSGGERRSALDRHTEQGGEADRRSGVERRTATNQQDGKP